LVARMAVHRGQVPFLVAWLGPVGGAAAGGAPGWDVRAVTARKAWASMDRVMCRYQARYLRTW
jgi:hypothetical protein